MASSDSAVRTMPHNTLAEETVLSAILTDPENTIDRCVEKLTPAHFYVRGNRMIYETCLAMREKAEVVETNSVVSRLKDAGHLEEVGGIFRVNQIATAFVTSANVDYYLGLLQEKHQLRRVIESSTRFIQMAYERQDSVEQVMDEVEKDMLVLCDSGAKAERNFREITQGMLENVTKINQLKGKLPGLNWGYRDLNRLTFGLKPGEMIVVAARPGIGKTAFALNVAERIAVDEGKPIGFMSLEMSAESLALRIACSRSRVNSRSFYHHSVNEGEMKEFSQAARAIEGAPIHIIEASMISISQLRSSTRRLHAKHKIEVLFVDYLQLVQSSGLGGRNDSREREVAQVSAGLKSLAVELNIPIVVLSQLNRESLKRDGGPQLSDLRESGAIEQDADIVCLLSRKDAANDRGEPEKCVVAEVYVAKNRNGPVGDLKLTFFPEITRFEDYRESDVNPA